MQTCLTLLFPFSIAPLGHKAYRECRAAHTSPALKTARRLPDAGVTLRILRLEVPTIPKTQDSHKRIRTTRHLPPILGEAARFSIAFLTSLMMGWRFDISRSLRSSSQDLLKPPWKLGMSCFLLVKKCLEFLSCFPDGVDLRRYPLEEPLAAPDPLSDEERGCLRPAAD